jgi:hypothetical protein
MMDKQHCEGVETAIQTTIHYQFPVPVIWEGFCYGLGQNQIGNFPLYCHKNMNCYQENIKFQE